MKTRVIVRTKTKKMKNWETDFDTEFAENLEVAILVEHK